MSDVDLSGVINPDKEKSSISKRDFTFISVIKAESKRRRLNLRDRLSFTLKTPTAPTKRQPI